MYKIIDTCIVLLIYCFASIGFCIDEGLISYWNFDEGSGVVLKDSSGNNNNGKIYGGEYVKSGDGYALKFDGVDDYVDCGNDESLNMTTGVTLEAWICPEEPKEKTYPGIVGKEAPFAYNLLCDYGYGCAFYIMNGSNWIGTGSKYGETGEIKWNKWSHLTATFDGSALKIYVNGDLKGSYESQYKNISREAKQRVFIGRYESFYYKGLIDEVRIYNRALSDKEVHSNYEVGRDKEKTEINPIRLNSRTYFNRKVVEVELKGLEGLSEYSVIDLEIRASGRDNVLYQRSISSLPKSGKTEVNFYADTLEEGEYEIRAIIRNETKKEKGNEIIIEKLRWKRPPTGPGVGLVAHYDFDEGEDAVLIDKSGNGNDGKIFGAKYIPAGKGYALEFDGIDDYVDCGNNKILDLRDAFTIEAWVYIKAIPRIGASIIVGKEDPGYRLVGWLGGTYYTMPSDNAISCPTGLWHHVVATFDGGVTEMYIDGQQLGYAVHKELVGKGGNFFIGKATSETGYFNGMIDNVRVYNRPLSEEEIRGHYESTKSDYGLNLRAYPYYFNKEIIVGMENIAPGADLELQIFKWGQSKSLLIKEVKLNTNTKDVEISLKADDLPAGDYKVQATVKDKEREQEITAVSRVIWTEKPRWSNQKPEMKVLNSVVTELVNVDSPSEDSYAFTNPRDGWVFVSSSVNAEVIDRVALLMNIDGEDVAIIVHEKGKNPTLEAMRYLPAGEYRIEIKREGELGIKNLIVRAIPELVFDRFADQPGGRHSAYTAISEYGSYGWDFLYKDVLKNCNVIVVNRAGQEPVRDMNKAEQWKKEGRKLLDACALPGIRREETSVEVVYNYWANHRAMNLPLLDGVIADELGSYGSKEFAIWTEAVKKIHDNPEFRRKTLNFYSGNVYYNEWSKNFCKMLMDYGYIIFFERYIDELPSMTIARGMFESALKQNVNSWKKAIPGYEKYMVVTPAYYSTPTLGMNINPGVDFKVHLDMQLHLIANDPVFWGIRGISLYGGGFADEEIVRWAGKLYRHYFIEGNTELLSKKYGYEYNLKHIVNPDFDEGSKWWILLPSEKQSIMVRHMDGNTNIQGRRYSGKGDNFIWMKRNAKCPNIFSQEIKNLKPGTLYSLKMYTGDYSVLSQGEFENFAKEKYAVSINIENVEFFPEKCFQTVVKMWGGIYGETNAPYINFHRNVFRANGNTAKIVISDWLNDKEPGGPIGQELMYNFIEVAPYLED